MIVVPPATCKQEVFLIDRKNNYYQVDNLIFPHHDTNSPSMMATGGMRTNTLLDGELVIDTIYPGKTKLRLLLFDCLAIDGQSLAHKPLGRRYASIRSHVLPPYQSFMKQNKLASIRAPFEVQLKPMDLAYGLETVLHDKMKHLQHQTDGLIFTSFTGGYTCGTDQKILKWKPKHENSIDFKIRLRFPPDLKADPSGSTPDFTAKPFFQLLQHVKGDDHEPFDYLDMSDVEWYKWKSSGQQLDDRIVECAWHPPAGQNEKESTWHIMRIRDDKANANHKSTVGRIIQSIRDGVDEEELIKLAPAIRAAWKAPERGRIRNKMASVKSVPFNKTCKGGGGPGAPMTRGGMPGLVRR